ncbi:efflux transporter outer membrane subunit [Piscinibacter sp. HJYY11]|uniref:efflux transporter outer membrane subunit n=1 Tax=Piscinibacter sp. HJYY11 TaxID=2801333 RepID=UPI001F002317|nr:efflux transporter outer membrane subunit [Piscinibacter sp. HJYY11]
MLASCQRVVLFIATATLCGCATSPRPEPESLSKAVPPQWHAPLPHGGNVAELGRWWASFDDPLLLRLIEQGQRVSATLAQAGARIADARAARVAGSASLLPALDASLNASRGIPSLGLPIATTASLGVQAGWEVDLFGANRAGAKAAQARLDASEAAWHVARVSLAAEVASAYIGLRACEAQQAQLELDVRSREETSRLTALAADAGFQAPAAADLARASAANGSAALTQQRAQCELFVKSLVALAALDEEALRQELAGSTARLPQPRALRVAEVPAEALAQRPDITAAAWDVVAASADADHARARRWPRITLSGSIGPVRQRVDGVSTDGTVWSIGPVAVTLPLFDAGARRANADAARARHDAARVAYAASLRAAVREVEAALVNLHSANVRGDDTRAAAIGFERSYQATEARFRGGLASLFELEDARRSLVAARSAQIEQQREAVAAWVETYRALGGGWSTP